MPTIEVQFVGEALRTFVAWPRNLILPYVGQLQVIYLFFNKYFL